MKIIEEGVTYTEEVIGIDANLVYRNLLDERRELRELRSYLHQLLNKLIKVTHQLDRKSPHIKHEIMSLIIEEIFISMRKALEKNHRSLDCRDVVQIWAETEFIERFLNSPPSENLKQCFKTLRKIFSKLKNSSKLAPESEIFSSDLSATKSSLLANELAKVKLLQTCLS
jgi:hypothetical protein